MRRKGISLVVILLFISVNIVQSTSKDVEVSFISPLYDGNTLHVCDDVVGCYKDYLYSRNNETYSFRKIKEISSIVGKPLVLIFVSAKLISNIEEEINVYCSTLIDVGYDIIVFETSGITVENLKNQILNYWSDGYDLAGIVLIGDFPVAWFKHDEEFPCDLFLMDMDGEWIDSDGDGLYDSHCDGDGDTAPEIYIGRIDASNVPSVNRGSIGIVKKYLRKVNEFWKDNITQNDFALTYIDHDWSGCTDMKHDIGYLYENYEVMTYPDVNRDDYLNNRLSGSYEFIQLSCHSKSFGHLFDNGGLAFSSNIRSAQPIALFYNLYCCYALRFTEYNCLGNAYILNTDSPSLAVVGSTKSGSMRDYKQFYESFGQGSSFGKSLKIWFEDKYPYDKYDIASYYGLTILGDPTLMVYKDYRANAHGPYYSLIDYSVHFTGSATGGIPPYTYTWDFGDGNTSTFKNVKHNFTKSGNYTVTFTIKDSEDNITSDVTWVKVKETNNPPNPPIISGPTTGKPWKKNYYDVVSDEPDGDEWLKYIIEWEHERFSHAPGPYKPGEVIKVYHKWNEKGTYYVRALAVDPYKGYSEWGELKVTISKNHHWWQDSFPFLSWLLERFPYAFPILRQMLGL